MIAELLERLATWSAYDTWIAVTAALSSMACAIPGVFLLLRRQSMMGDALSHTSLLGIALGFLAAVAMREAGWLSPAAFAAVRHAAIFAGAVVIGVLASLLTETIHRLGRVEAGAALGVVFTTLFALGLLLIRLVADQVDLDPDCVLYGVLESQPPHAPWVNGGMFLLNALLVVLLFKELRIATFDPALATAQGISAAGVHYALMGVTAATLVAAFESVGSILVIAMLIAPGATALLLSQRLAVVVLLAVLLAGISGVVGHALSIAAPALLPLGPAGTIQSVGTSGMMAVTAGALFGLAVLLAPRQGLLSRMLHRLRLAVRTMAEDVLGQLYRRQEALAAQRAEFPAAPGGAWGRGSTLLRWLALRLLRCRGWIARGPTGYCLTAKGRQHAQHVVCSHRLWETYMSRHFALPDDHLHATAERVEHYIDLPMRDSLARELDRPQRDPHGREIPGTNGGA